MSCLNTCNSENFQKKILFKIKQYDKISNKELKKIKQLVRKMTGESLYIFNNQKTIIGYINKKIVCICSISLFSPESHFNNELCNKGVPYLYNYICDANYKKYKNSYQLMLFIKKYLLNEFYAKFINLDVLKTNKHAQQFFVKNGFIKCGEYIKKKNNKNVIYYKYTFTYNL